MRLSQFARVGEKGKTEMKIKQRKSQGGVCFSGFVVSPRASSLVIIIVFLFTVG